MPEAPQIIKDLCYVLFWSFIGFAIISYAVMVLYTACTSIRSFFRTMRELSKSEIKDHESQT